MPDDHPAFPLLTLTAEDLAATRGGRPVLAGVSFDLHGGEAMALRGPNGAGKSTLLRLVAGLLKPSAGRIELTPAGDTGIGPRAHYAGHLDALKAGLTVAQNLTFWARVWGGEAGSIDEALDTVGLGRMGTLPASVLSAGQRRRAALARLLVVRRPLWLLDEPTASLDAAGERMLGQVVGSHLAAGGIAIIATHVELPVALTQILTLGAA